MKKPIRPILIGASLLGLLGLRGCQHRFESTVYGPPPDTDNPSYQEEPSDVYGPPAFEEPYNDEPQSEYGPPEANGQ